MKHLAHIMRNINGFNIPVGNSCAFEIMYFGVNLILMLDYRLSFDIDVKIAVYQILLQQMPKGIPRFSKNRL
jgi:hypothetical protein